MYNTTRSENLWALESSNSCVFFLIPILLRLTLCTLQSSHFAHLLNYIRRILSSFRGVEKINKILCAWHPVFAQNIVIAQWMLAFYISFTLNIPQGSSCMSNSRVNGTLTQKITYHMVSVLLYLLLSQDCSFENGLHSGNDRTGDIQTRGAQRGAFQVLDPALWVNWWGHVLPWGCSDLLFVLQ